MNPDGFDVFEFLTPKERAELIALVSTFEGFQELYKGNLRGFVRDCISWDDGESAKAYQNDVFDLIPNGRTSVRAMHGVGKTALAALAILWFALTRDGWADWKIVTTAGSHRQLTKFLWPEVHKWARRLRWDRIHRAPFHPSELLDMAIKLSTGEAFAVASDNAALIEGAHAKRMFYVFDESKAIPGKTFDAAEGAFTQAGLAGHEALALAISTPGPPIGRFYDIQSRKKGYHDWQVKHINLKEVIACGQLSQQWADNRKAQWGESSAVYRNRVLGEFASDDEKGIIPLSWIEAANARWLEWKDRIDIEQTMPIVTHFGVDVARSGLDKNIKAIRCEESNLTIISELVASNFNQDTMETTGIVRGLIRKTGGVPVVDVLNMGAGVVDRLRELGETVIAFNASIGVPELTDRSGEFTFLNLRAAAWWGLRERLDPASPLKPLALPPDDELTADLSTPYWKVTSSGAIQVEGKDEIKKRLDGRSTDRGDAVMMSLAAEIVPTRSGDARWEMF